MYNILYVFIYKSTATAAATYFLCGPYGIAADERDLELFCEPLRAATAALWPIDTNARTKLQTVVHIYIYMLLLLFIVVVSRPIIFNFRPCYKLYNIRTFCVIGDLPHIIYSALDLLFMTPLQYVFLRVHPRNTGILSSKRRRVIFHNAFLTHEHYTFLICIINIKRIGKYYNTYTNTHDGVAKWGVGDREVDKISHARNLNFTSPSSNALQCIHIGLKRFRAFIFPI